VKEAVDTLNLLRLTHEKLGEKRVSRGCLAPK
jgi:hypothetical protein